MVGLTKQLPLPPLLPLYLGLYPAKKLLGINLDLPLMLGIMKWVL